MQSSKFISNFQVHVGAASSYIVSSPGVSLRTRPSKNRKGGSGKSAGVEVYTAPGVQAHFQLAFD